MIVAVILKSKKTEEEDGQERGEGAGRKKKNKSLARKANNDACLKRRFPGH